VQLIAHNGDRDDAQERYYFAAPYHSWHGSPSRRDSNIPLIVAHRGKRTAEIEATVRSFLGAEGRAQDVGTLLLGLREGKKRTVAKDLSNTPR
jgi:hypothetical protein